MKPWADKVKKGKRSRIPPFWGGEFSTLKILPESRPRFIIV